MSLKNKQIILIKPSAFAAENEVISYNYLITKSYYNNILFHEIKIINKSLIIKDLENIETIEEFIDIIEIDSNKNIKDDLTFNRIYKNNITIYDKGSY